MKRAEAKQLSPELVQNRAKQQAPHLQPRMAKSHTFRRHPQSPKRMTMLNAPLDQVRQLHVQQAQCNKVTARTKNLGDPVFLVLQVASTNTRRALQQS